MTADGATLYLMRHGETQANLELRFNGRADSPLTELGVREARRHGRVLRGLVGPETALRVVSSPLGRARHTAQLVREELGRGEVALETDERLTEISFGSWEGLTIAEIDRRYPGALDRRHAELWTFTIPEGESYEMVARRAAPFLAEAEGTLVVVTHGAVERILRGLYAGLPKREICRLDEPQDVFFKLAEGQVTAL